MLTASIKLTLTNQEDKDQIIKYGIWFGGRRHRADNFVEISPNTVCSTSCHWCYITLQCPNVVRLRCQLCKEPHTTMNYKCDLKLCPARAGWGCRHTVVRCTNCRGTHYAMSSAFLMRRQTIVLAQSDRNEWRPLKIEH